MCLHYRSKPVGRKWEKTNKNQDKLEKNDEGGKTGQKIIQKKLKEWMRDGKKGQEATVKHVCIETRL